VLELTDDDNACDTQLVGSLINPWTVDARWNFRKPVREDPTRSFSVRVRLSRGFLVVLVIEIFGDDALGIDVLEEDVGDLVKKLSVVLLPGGGR
jgi:hypothetical protein